MLHVAPSLTGRDCSPASSGVRVTVPSSSTKQGIPAAPLFFAASNTGLWSRSYRKSLEYPPNCSRLTQQDLIIRELEEKRRSWADS